MRWALPLGSVLGIRIRMHATFLLLVAWIAYIGWAAGGVVASAWAIVLILSLFACVVLHELGHSVVALHYGVEVTSITLLPIGGVAAMRSMPEKPSQELLIAIAGPMVNVLIAGVLLLILGGLPPTLWITAFPTSGGELLTALLKANLILILFNMVPAFPMDGGRVLRSSLAMVMPFTRATSIAATVGQIMATLFIVFGIMQAGIVLILIGLFVFIGAEGEDRMVRVRNMLSDVRAEDVMVTQFVSLDSSDRIDRCLEFVYHSKQEDFPVMCEGRLVGLLPRKLWVAALHKVGGAAKVGEVMLRDFRTYMPHDNVSRFYLDMLSRDQFLYPVLQGDRVVGLITPDEISRFLMVQEARRGGAKAAPTTLAEGPARERDRFSVDLG